MNDVMFALGKDVVV